MAFHPIKETPLYTSALDYDSEGNEILVDYTKDPLKDEPSDESSDESRRRGGDITDLTSNESLNESYNEEGPIVPQDAPLHVDAPYWYKFGALMVQFPANIIGTWHKKIQKIQIMTTGGA